MGYITARASQIRTIATADYLCDTADSLFPKQNVGVYRYPNRPWKSTSLVASASPWIGANLGSAVTNAAVIVDNINVASVKVEAATNNIFTTGVTSTTSAVSINPLNGRGCLYFDAAAYSAKQYWRVLDNSSTTTDGETVMVVGSLLFCSTVTTWPGGSGDYAETPLQSVRVNDDFVGGGAEPVILGNRYGSVTLGQSPASRADMRTPLLTLLGEGIGQYFVFYKNDGDTSEVYVCRRAADVTVTQTTPTAIEYAALMLQGAV